MILSVSNIATRISDASALELAWIESFLTFQDESKRFSTQGGKTRANRNTRTTLFFQNQTFPSGLMSMILREAKLEDIDITVIDKRTWPYPGVQTLEALYKTTTIPTDAIDWLYDYQGDAVEACIRKTRGIVHAPTAAGKGEMFAAITMIVPLRWLVIVPEQGLLNNAAERIELRSLEPVGRIGDGKFDDEKRVTVATYQSLLKGVSPIRHGASPKAVERKRRVKKLLTDVQAVFYDEVHQAAADGSYRILMNTPNAFYRFGCSGTPLSRSDRKSVLAIAALGDLIYTIPTTQLMAEGRVSKPTIIMVPCDQEGETHTKDGKAIKWTKAYKKLMIMSRKRNRIVIELVKRVPKPALIFVTRIAHGAAITKELAKQGIAAEFIWGDKATPQREDVLKRLREETLDVCVCNVVFQTGIDIPALRGIVNVGGGMSSIATIQRVGRGARVTKHKKTFVVYDILDRNIGPEHSTAKFAAKHAKRRMRDYSREGWTVTVDETLGAQIVLGL